MVKFPTGVIFGSRTGGNDRNQNLSRKRKLNAYENSEFVTIVVAGGVRSAIVNYLAKELLTNLQSRGAISAVNQIESNEYEYLGLVTILKCWNADSVERWNWYIYDGWEMVIEQGVTDNSNSALATARQWIDDFDASLFEKKQSQKTYLPDF